MARTAARQPVTEAEYGRAVLALVDTTLDALSSTDIDDLAAFRCGTATVRIRTSGAPRSEYLPFSHLPTAPGPDDAAPTATELVVHVSDGPFPAHGGTTATRGLPPCTRRPDVRRRDRRSTDRRGSAHA